MSRLPSLKYRDVVACLRSNGFAGLTSVRRLLVPEEKLSLTDDTRQWIVDLVPCPGCEFSHCL